MADKEASLIIRLKDLASKELSDLQGAIGKLRSQFLLIATTITGVVATFYSAIKAYAESEEAVNKLETALRNQGVTSKAVSKDLQDYAKALQRQTTFSDEAIMGAQSLLITFGLSGEKLKQTTTSALNLSTVLGIDLHTATLMLGKAINGNETALNRYGLTLDDVSRMSGSAEAATRTITGRIENMKNRIDELQEKIGQVLVPTFEYWVRLLEKATSAVEKFSGASDESLKGRELTIAALEKEKTAIENNLASLQRHASEGNTVTEKYYKDRLAKIEAAISREREIKATEPGGMEGASTPIGREPQEDTELQSALNKETTKREGLLQLRQYYDMQEANLIAQFNSTQEQAALASQLKRLNSEKKFNDMKRLGDAALRKAQEENETKLQEFRLKQEEERKKNLLSTLNYISTLSTSKNKELALIGKAAAISMAYINTSVAVTMALKSAPPPFNFALAAAVAAAGLSQVANIAGTPLAEGGIVMPRSGGTLATIGEAGSAEAVIPLDDPEAMEALGGMGRGQTVININAGILVADDLSVQEFAKRIDEELYKLQRRSMSLSFGG